MAKKGKNIEQQGYEVLGKLIDVKLFGGMVPNESRVIGAVQCEWATSIHPIKVEEVKITSAFSSAEHKGQGSMGKKHFVPYGLYSVGYQYSASRSRKFKEFVGEGLTKKDMEWFEEGLMYGTSHNRTASKGFIEPVAIVKVVKSERVKSRYDGLADEIKAELVEEDVFSHEDIDLSTKGLRDRLKDEDYKRVDVYVKPGMEKKYKDLLYLKRSRDGLHIEEEDLDTSWEYVVLYEVKHSNPNGDPDRDNEPRRWEGTDIGIISPERQKRWVRDYIEDHGEMIFVTRKGKVQKAKERMKEIEDLI